MKRNYFESKTSSNGGNDVNWYDILLEAAKRYAAHIDDFDEDNEDDLEGEKAYDDEETKDDAAFADFDRRHVSGYDDDSKCFGGHFGAGFEIDEPRPQDYTDKKKFEDDLAAYDRFVEAGEDCVRRGLEKPEWVDLGKPTSDDPYYNDDIPYDDEDIDDDPSSDDNIIVNIYICH